MIYHNVILNGKKFYDQVIDSGIKQCEGNRKLKEDKEKIIQTMFVRLQHTSVYIHSS